MGWSCVNGVVKTSCETGCGYVNETVMCEGVTSERSGSLVKRMITCELGCG